MTSPRFIFDTNTLVSASLIKKSVSASALTTAFEKGNLIFSTNTFREFVEVIYREKFDKYFEARDRIEFINKIESNSLFVQTNEAISICRDPKDNMFLELGVASQASCIISGDPDLLVLHPFRNIPILNATAFLQQF